MITLERLTKRRGAQTVLASVTLAFEPQSVVSIVGPSGAGKSTLLRCINGLEDFDEGRVVVGEHVLGPGDEQANRAARTAVRRKVGFVFQQWNLFAHRTALGNVIEGPVHVRRMPRAEAMARGRALLEKVGVLHREAAYPHELSGGEQQRVAIARALAMEPEVLLLDEPTSALDPERRREVRAVLSRLASEGTTMILVTHEMQFAREVSHRVVVLNAGRVVEEGPPGDVLFSSGDERTGAPLGLETTREEG